MDESVFHLVATGQRRAWCVRDGYTYAVLRVGPHLLLRGPAPQSSRSFDTVDACRHAMTQIVPLSDWEVVP